MSGCHDDCTVDVPSRLHGKGRDLREVPPADRIYLWFKPEPRYTGEFSIPGLVYCNQSANSHVLNEDGVPQDVLFDTKNGGKMAGLQIACIAVADLRRLAFPNVTAQSEDEFGNKIERPGENATFDVVHVPTPCMFPHCEIKTTYRGIICDREKNDITSRPFKKKIRSEICRLASLHVEAMREINASLTVAES